MRSRFVVLVIAAALLGVGPARAVHGGSTSTALATACRTKHWGHPRRPPHAARQRRVVRRLRHHPAYRTFTVERARATGLGVVALVTGDQDAATRELRGVAHVRSWNHGIVGSLPKDERMREAIGQLVQPDTDQLVRSVQHMPGLAVIAYWPQDAGEVMTWKAPVPARVRRLAGVRPDGVDLRVVAVRYSQDDVDKASDRLGRYLDRQHVEWTDLHACASGGGLVLGVPMPAGQFPVDEADLRNAAGMPVLVRGNVYGGA